MPRCKKKHSLEVQASTRSVCRSLEQPCDEGLLAVLLGEVKNLENRGRQISEAGKDYSKMSASR